MSVSLRNIVVTIRHGSIRSTPIEIRTDSLPVPTFKSSSTVVYLPTRTQELSVPLIFPLSYRSATTRPILAVTRIPHQNYVSAEFPVRLFSRSVGILVAFVNDNRIPTAFAATILNLNFKFVAWLLIRPGTVQEATTTRLSSQLLYKKKLIYNPVVNSIQPTSDSSFDSLRSIVITVARLTVQFVTLITYTFCASDRDILIIFDDNAAFTDAICTHLYAARGPPKRCGLSGYSFLQSTFFASATAQPRSTGSLRSTILSIRTAQGGS